MKDAKGQQCPPAAYGRLQTQAGANVADNMLKLWEQNRRFIFKMANRYRGQAEEDDLVQEGYLGLCRAVDGYDPDQGIDFLPYAGNWIRQGMARFIHNNGTVRIAVHEQESLYQYRRPGKAKHLRPFLADYIDTHAYRGSTAAFDRTRTSSTEYTALGLIENGL
ncbi:MAG: sigma-70 family RNA polymerase sigma factor [Lachnospiraceae bacterium]|nr:sigma-70 family RNA polymerase sigma factor [Lachnospiraceae bacterium]